MKMAYRFNDKLDFRLTTSEITPMRSGSFALPKKWSLTLKEFPETGMGYLVVTVSLKDERVFEQVLIDSGYVVRVRGLADVPFGGDEIVDIKPTHAKWDWTETP
ncbi:MAG TPA: hypothetical protein VFO34_17405 [Candidatus Acidoferrales bacterium]|nr:hypothetical protein [Candidatus Acidoferrales bacterium]